MVKMNDKIAQIRRERVYFYERPDGSIIPCGAKEAWDIHKKFKQVGVGDGLFFEKALNEARELFKTEGLEAAQARIKLGEQEELEAAKGHLEKPPQNDVFGSAANELSTKLRI